MGIMILGAKIKVEPYWNVNIGASITVVSATEIKVEPYWNVNIWIKVIIHI